MLKKQKASVIPVWLFLLLAILIAALPLLFTVTNSFMTQQEQLNRYDAAVTGANKDDFQSNGVHFVRPGLLPEQPTMSQYTRLLFQNPGYLRMFWNSVLLLVPNFIVAGWLQIRDSYLAVILPALFHPFGVFLIRQQLKGFPKQCSEAAALDGANAWQTYRHVVFPNLKSVMAAMTVLLFVDNWNIVDQAVVFIEGLYRQPLSVYLGSAAGSLSGIFFAASVVYMIPAVLVFLLGQDGLAKGISLSNLKN